MWFATRRPMKDDLHQLVDALPEREVYAARRFLEELRDAARGASRGAPDDPVLRAFMDAPEDDEPLTAEDAAAIAEAHAEIARGEGRPWEAVRADLGLAHPDPRAD